MSESGSEAPEPQGSALPAAVHPFFQSVANRGRGRARQDEPASDAPPQRVGSRLVPLDFGTIECNLRASNEDIESAIDSEDEEAHECSEPPPKRARADSVREAAAAAAFGADQEGTPSEAAETASNADSETRINREVMAAKRIFPIRGVKCVGCVLEAAVISRVDSFVQSNQHRLEANALFKTAAAFYKSTFSDNSALHGERLPDWGWKDIKSHYLLHVVDPQFQRIDALRSLAACRKMIESALVREEEDGSKSLDSKQADVLLKVVAMQSRELSLLRATSMPPPPPTKK